MFHYNPIPKTNIIVDAGPKCLGTILSQKQKNGQFKPISYSSRALTDVESRYSQTEKEALAITWAFQHYHYYIYDRHVTVYTDQKPLEQLLTTSPTPSQEFKDGSCVSKLTNIQSDIDQESKMWQTYYHDPLHYKHLQKIQESSKFMTQSMKLFQFPWNYHTHHRINKIWNDKGSNQIIRNKPVEQIITLL